MGKYIKTFVAFCGLFILALIIIYYKANPSLELPGEQFALEWHGRIENEYGTYNGALIGDLFSGEGSFKFLTGELYTGDWQESYMSGEGITIFPEIGEYSGTMTESKRNGQGTFTWYSGEIYVGNWENDEMTGNGKYIFANGSIFDGTFERNKAISGTLIYQADLDDNANSTDISYIKYSFSASTNNIVFQTKGGLKYDGDTSGLIETGNATITYSSGNTYTGEISAGQRNGSGKYTWNDSSGKATAYYEGDWVSDHMSGQGEYHYTSSEYPYLQGTFNNDLPAGTLIYYKTSADTYETEWENGTCTSIKET